LVLAAKQKRLPQVIYWGPPLPASDDCTALAAAHALDVTGGMLDANPDLSICPEASQSFPGQPGLICRDALGRVLRPEFRFVKDLAQGQNLCLTYATKIWA
jgi:alpha-galactosidase